MASGIEMRKGCMIRVNHAPMLSALAATASGLSVLKWRRAEGRISIPELVAGTSDLQAVSEFPKRSISAWAEEVLHRLGDDASKGELLHIDT